MKNIRDFNDLWNYLYDLAEISYEQRENIVSFILNFLMFDSNALEDTELERRLKNLTDTFNFTSEYLNHIALKSTTGVSEDFACLVSASKKLSDIIYLGDDYLFLTLLYPSYLESPETTVFKEKAIEININQAKVIEQELKVKTLKLVE